MQKVNVNGVQVAYERRGSGTPLVLLHGYPLDHRIWNEVVPLLEDDFDMIVPDLRGFGQSEVVEAQYTLADMAADVAALLDELGVEKTYIAGHSMGGYTSLAFVRNDPERVLGLGLIASQAPNDTPERKKGRYASAEEIMKTGVEPVVENMTPKLTPDAQVQGEVRDVIAQQHRTGLANAMKAMAERLDSTSQLSSFRFPVVLVHGEADELIPVERAREITDALQTVYFVELSGVGHLPMLEKPQETAGALRKLIS